MSTTSYSLFSASELSDALPWLVLSDVVLFPGTGSQLELKDAELVKYLASKPSSLVAVFKRKAAAAKDEAFSASNFYPIGTLARVVAIAQHEGGAVAVLRGVARVSAESSSAVYPFVAGRVQEAADSITADDEFGALSLALRQSVETVLTLLKAPEEFAVAVRSMTEPGALADFVATRLEMTVEDKAELLSIVDVKARVRAVLSRVAHRIEVLKMRDDISAQVRAEMSKAERNYLLRQQMRAIEKELGDNGDDKGNEADAFEKRLREASLSPEAME